MTGFEPVTSANTGAMLYQRCSKSSFKTLIDVISSIGPRKVHLGIRCNLSEIIHVIAKSNECEAVLGDLGAARYLGGCDVFGRKFTSRADKSLGTYSYRTTSRSVPIPFRHLFVFVFMREVGYCILIGAN